MFDVPLTVDWAVEFVEMFDVPLTVDWAVEFVGVFDDAPLSKK